MYKSTSWVHQYSSAEFLVFTFHFSMSMLSTKHLKFQKDSNNGQVKLFKLRDRRRFQDASNSRLCNVCRLMRVRHDLDVWVSCKGHHLQRIVFTFSYHRVPQENIKEVLHISIIYVTMNLSLTVYASSIRDISVLSAQGHLCWCSYMPK